VDERTAGVVPKVTEERMIDGGGGLAERTSLLAVTNVKPILSGSKARPNLCEWSGQWSTRVQTKESNRGSRFAEAPTGS